MTRANKIIALATARFEYFAEALVRALPDDFARGLLHTSFFPNGETRLEIEALEQFIDAEVLLIGGTEKEDLFDLLLVAGELARSCQRLNILIPFFRYATQERKDSGKAGHIVLARGMAEILSALPVARGGNRVFLVDPHTEELATYFDSTRMQVETISLAPVLAQIALQAVPGGLNAKVISSVDDGRTAEVQEVADLCGLPAAFVAKERVSGSETRVVGEVKGDVFGRIAVMVDDMGRTLGSAAGAAQAYRAAGATAVWLVASHPDYAPGALEKLRAKGVVDGVITTDTYHSAQSADGTFGRVVSAAPFVASEIARRIG